ncbi:MAG: KTSC domain-containing protein [Anaerotignum propionicum]|uniref:KTSC domain-containing protein n=1 Tax=Anaerotignum propionicum TaxID=28446 RepID=UPI002B20FA44|nr:KTSC domain-containing protein [Anaerotignum propionicum]MEA5056120.1 KTSC domain-containing protein [Anaerotignum propionicum]
MERQYIDSSMITSIGYDATSCILEVEFKRGIIWQYHEFPEYMWYEFQSAESQGKYFNSNIREQFTPLGHRV